MRWISIGFALTLIAANPAASPAAAARPKGLSADERAQLHRAEPVLKPFDVPGAPWPKVTVYQFVRAKPLEAMAFLGVVEHQRDYVPNVLRSDVTKIFSPTEVVATYEIETPWFLPNVHSRQRHRIRALGHDRYEVRWDQIYSNTTEEVHGRARFEPYGRGTLMTYKIFVRPKSVLAPLVVRAMLSALEETVVAIARYAETSLRNEPERVRGLVQNMSDALDLRG